MSQAIKKSIPFLTIALSLFAIQGQEPEKVLISTEQMIFEMLPPSLLRKAEIIGEQNGRVLLRFDEYALDQLSGIIHEKAARCGGYFIEDSESDFFATEFQSQATYDYEITQPEIVREMLPKVDKANILGVIEDLSSFQNRHYRSETGVASQLAVKERWRQLTEHRDDVEIEVIAHNGYDQPSIALTIEGATNPDEIIVIGGHGDSIAGWGHPSRMHAPGADDNASGIATITEILRVLGDYRLDRTLKVISYAAEEVGLRGSHDIARSFQEDALEVVGVMQFDMTNFRGSNYDMVFMTDFVDPNLTEFLKDLTRTYLPNVQFTEDRCGYACSDHASWTRSGFPAAIAFESLMREYNGHIHTPNDTLDKSNNDADHAVNFAKLGVAFIAEVGGIVVE